MKKIEFRRGWSIDKSKRYNDVPMMVSEFESKTHEVDVCCGNIKIGEIHKFDNGTRKAFIQMFGKIDLKPFDKSIDNKISSLKESKKWCTETAHKFWNQIKEEME